jgi:transposase
MEGSDAAHRAIRALIKRGKTNTVAVTAIARELTGFIWAIDRALRDETTAA